MKTRVYVDGLNLYYGAVKGTPFKWLDPVRLSALVLPPTCVVDRLLYFTAHVSGVADPGAPARQQIYLNALQTLPEVEVYFGSFLAKTVWRPVINLPVAGKAIATPQPVTLPAGNHPVAGVAADTARGELPRARGVPEEAAQDIGTAAGCGDRRVSGPDGGEGFGCESGGAPAQ